MRQSPGPSVARWPSCSPRQESSCLDSSHPAVKRAAAPLIVRALEQAAELDTDLDRSGGGAAAQGRALPASSLGDGAALVMLEGTQGRDRLVASEGGFVTRRARERFSLDELRRIAATEPTRLSPNVLLRPVVESALLPTVAYVAGPGELRYLVLTPPVYERLRHRPTAAHPSLVGYPGRAEGGSRAGKVRCHARGPACSPEERSRHAWCGPSCPAKPLQALERMRAALEAGYDALARSAEEIDPTLARPIQGARHQALTGTQDVEKKLVQHLKRRQETELGQIARARGSVLPGNKPQERVLTAVPFLARYGPALLTDLGAHIEAWYEDALEGAAQPA